MAAKFGRDLDFDLQRIATLIEHGRQSGVSLLVLPDAALGGYLADLRRPDPNALPPALELDDPHIRKVAALAAEMVVCFGFCEADGDRRYNTALCVHGDGVLGSHRKVHQPAGESIAYSAGERFTAFDTPVGRTGMLIDYDKTFPESARSLAGVVALGEAEARETVNPRLVRSPVPARRRRPPPARSSARQRRARSGRDGCSG